MMLLMAGSTPGPSILHAAKSVSHGVQDTCLTRLGLADFVASNTARTSFSVIHDCRSYMMTVSSPPSEHDDHTDLSLSERPPYCPIS